jgi:D-alanine-D-alanine ligase
MSDAPPAAPPPRVLPPAGREVRVLLVAKHARGDGAPDQVDGTHATYHREMRDTLEAIGVDLRVADRYEALFERPEADFVFPLLNRGGFLNSEMLLPLLCERHGLPYLGASPIVRGLSDDKHLAKHLARGRGVRTAPWAMFRRGAPIDPGAIPAAERYVIKPNASSASWGVSDATDHAGVVAAVRGLHAEGHDAIVEPFLWGHDLEVSVVTLGGRPFILPIQIVRQEDPGELRTYAEKRNLADAQHYRIQPLDDPRLDTLLRERTDALFADYVPFDYGRFEFRLDEATGEPVFLEVNLNCNLWSRKTISLAAGQMGWSHRQTIETILVESLERHGLVEPRLDLAA